MHWRSWWVHSENLIKRSRWGVSSSYGLHVMQVKLLCYFYICLLYYIHAHRCNGPARYTVWNLMMSVPLFLSRATAAVVCVAWKAVLRLLGWCVSWLLSSTQNLNLDFGQNFTWFACDGRNFRASLLQMMMPQSVLQWCLTYWMAVPEIWELISFRPWCLLKQVA